LFLDKGPPQKDPLKLGSITFGPRLENLETAKGPKQPPEGMVFRRCVRVTIDLAIDHMENTTVNKGITLFGASYVRSPHKAVIPNLLHLKGAIPSSGFGLLSFSVLNRFATYR